MRQQRRLEITLQGKFRADEDRLAPRCVSRPEGTSPPEPIQAPVIPRKEDAGTRPLPPGQRAGNGQKLRRSRNRRDALEGPLQEQVTFSGSFGFCSLGTVVSLQSSVSSKTKPKPNKNQSSGHLLWLSRTYCIDEAV